MPRGLRYAFAFGVSLPLAFVTFAALPQPDAGVATSAEVAALSLDLELAQKRTEVLQMTIESTQQTQSLGLTVIGVLLGVVGLVVPIVTFMVNVLPARQVLADARRALDELNTIDERFAKFTAEQQRRDIHSTIERLEDDNQSIRLGAANHLLANAHAELTDAQIGTLCRIARGTDVVLQNLLLSVLSGRESPAVESLLSDLLAGATSEQSLHYALRYVHAFPGRELISSIKKCILTKPGRLLGTLTGAATFAPALLVELVNDHEFIDSIPFTYSAGCYKALLTPAFDPVRETVRNSVLAKRFSGRRRFFLKRVGNRYVPSSQDEAAQVGIYEDGQEIKQALRGGGTEPSAAWNALMAEPVAEDSS